MIDIVYIIPEITKGMKSFGPKSLITVRNISILEYQLMQARAMFRNSHIYLLTGFESERIEKTVFSSKHITGKKNIHIIENKEYESHSQSSSIMSYVKQRQSDQGAMFINNGILIKYNFTKINKNQNHLFFLNGIKSNFNIGTANLDQTEYLFYDLPHLWSECAYLSSSTIEHIGKLALEDVKSIFFFELINKLIEKRFIFNSISVPKNQITKITHIKDTNKIKHFIYQ